MTKPERERDELRRLLEEAERALDESAKVVAEKLACDQVERYTLRAENERLRAKLMEAEERIAGLAATRRHLLKEHARTTMPGPVHVSDCALHNEPAEPIGPCDCGVTPPGPVCTCENETQCQGCAGGFALLTKATR